MRTTLYMAMTVNGYIAKENDETPWSDATWNHYYALVKEKGNLVVGERTYEIMKKASEFKELGEVLVVVVTKDLKKHADDPDRAFVSSPRMALDVLEERKFDEALVGGGSTLNASFLKEGLIDELVLDVEPMLFGRGIKLFTDTEIEKRLTFVSVEKLSAGAITLHYKTLK